MTTVLAIDPGASGAACLYGGATVVGPLQLVKFARLDEAEVFRAVHDMAREAQRCVIERVQAMPGGGERRMGATSAFTFGRGVGLLRGALYAAGTPWEDVAPQTWQRQLGLGKCSGPDRKRALKALAQQRFPTLSPTLDTCDALLLAEWAWLRWAVPQEATA